MELIAHDPGEYLVGGPILGAGDRDVAAVAGSLRGRHGGDVAFAAAAFEFVRDRIAHSWDARDRRVTLSASQALRERVGLCFAKSHLLAALLRARGVPAGLCYQRLTDDGGRFEVHGLVAVHLEGGWRRQDPRGKRGVEARFSLGAERLAWPVRPELGERDYPDVYVDLHTAVLAALRGATDALELCGGGLPEDLCPAAESVAPHDGAAP